MGLWVGFDVIDDLGFMDATPIYGIEPNMAIIEEMISINNMNMHADKNIDIVLLKIIRYT